MPTLDLGRVVGAEATINGHNSIELMAGGSAYLEQEDDIVTVVASNTNLLDNWYFADPINQRGQTEYTGLGYTIDRWYQASNGEILITDSGIKCTFTPEATTAGIVMRQALDNAVWLRGKTVTMSILIDSTNSRRCKPLIEIIGGTQNGKGFSPDDSAQVSSGIYSHTATLPNDFTGLRFWIYLGDARVDAGGEVSIVSAAKLELGEKQTLARQDESGAWVLIDPLPNKALELQKCQRFGVKYGEYSRIRACMVSNVLMQFYIPTPVTLRAFPAIVGTPVVENLSSVEQSGFTFSVAQADAGGVLISARKDAHGLTDGQLRLNNVMLDSSL